MRRDESTTPEDLDRPEGNGLKANYDLHDTGEAEFIERCEGLDLVVEEWGLDRRDDDGEDGVIYDDAMDFKVYVRCNEARAEKYLEGGVLMDTPGSADAEPLRLAALVDVKTKSSPRYMGRFNLRHYENYTAHAAEYGVPTFVVMMQVSYGGDEIHDEFTFRMPRVEGAVDESARVLSSKRSDAVDTFPDGNHAALVKHEYRRGWGDFVSATVGRRRTAEDERTLDVGVTE